MTSIISKERSNFFHTIASIKSIVLMLFWLTIKSVYWLCYWIGNIFYGSKKLIQYILFDSTIIFSDKSQEMNSFHIMILFVYWCQSFIKTLINQILKTTNPVYCLCYLFGNSKKVCDHIQLDSTILFSLRCNPIIKLLSYHKYIFLLMFWFIIFILISQTQPTPWIEYGNF